MGAEIRSDHDSEWAAMARVSDLLGVGTPETVRKWVSRGEAIQRRKFAAHHPYALGEEDHGVGRADLHCPRKRIRSGCSLAWGARSLSRGDAEHGCAGPTGFVTVGQGWSR